MKVLFVTGLTSFGGQEAFLANLAGELALKGIEVHIVCPPNPRLEELINQRKLKLIDFPFVKQFDFGTLTSLIKLISEGDYDIIHTHGPRGGYYGRLAASLAKTNAEVIHQMYTPTHSIAGGDVGKGDLLTKKRGEIYVFIERKLAKFTEQVLTVSKHLKKYAISRIGIPEQKVHVVYNTTIRKQEIIDPSSIVKTKNNQFDTPLTLLFAGRFTYDKGIPILINSVSQILQEENRNSIQVILCGDGILDEEIRSLVKIRDLQYNVSFKGWQNDLTPFYQSCDVLVLPSLWEGLPLVILEAMSNAKAVISTNVGGIPEAVIDGETGILVEPNNIEELSSAILKCIQDRQTVQDMGLRGYDLCFEKFTLEKSVEKTLDLYLS